ncbi:MAG TPA: S24/S26 family peptidase [Coriobacteriia bacterium]
MREWARPLRRVCAAAAALLLALLLAPRFGAVYVAGWSMSPSLTAGDLAIYRRGADDVRERDVVLVARGDGSRVVHRVTAVLLDGSVRTRGDAGAAEDAGVAAPSQVEGVVIAAMPCGRLVHAVVSAGRWCYNHVPIANTRR